ncbi:MAG: P-II family nitrogen regulator [Vicinamibacteria bacterium]|jgi:nitrogen regulatory protein P-II 2|nr:P-II family nitrogen regulator [Vicinamibacteria bacterium]
MQTSPLHFVVAFIQPFQLDPVLDAVRALPNFPGISISEVRGFGAHAAHAPREGDRSEVYPVAPRLRLEVFCRADELIAIIETIRKAAHTGHSGDGKVFAGPVSLACRVSSAEWGETAILPASRRATETGA